jgi:hypothetical protein
MNDNNTINSQESKNIFQILQEKKRYLLQFLQEEINGLNYLIQHMFFPIR